MPFFLFLKTALAAGSLYLGSQYPLHHAFVSLCSPSVRRRSSTSNRCAILTPFALLKRFCAPFAEVGKVNEPVCLLFQQVFGGVSL